MNDIARQLLEARDQISPKWSGLLTQAARALATVQADQPDDTRRCRGCGDALPPQARGRPRKWCQAPDCQQIRKNGGKKPAKRTMGTI